MVNDYFRKRVKNSLLVLNEVEQYKAQVEQLQTQLQMRPDIDPSVSQSVSQSVPESVSQTDSKVSIPKKDQCNIYHYVD